MKRTINIEKREKVKWIDDGRIEMQKDGQYDKRRDRETVECQNALVLADKILRRFYANLMQDLLNLE